MNSIEQYLKKIISLIYKPIIAFGRVACIGKDVFALRHKGDVRLVNLQKARLDLLINWVNGAPRPKAMVVEEYMARTDVFPMIEQQERIEWLTSKKIPKFIMMDSFSELTDQQFTHREEGWSFCCHYTDLNHTPEFERQFDSKGLLAIEKIEETYYNFFNWLEKTMSVRRVIFVHYSTRFDSRPEFRERANEILRVMQKLELSKPYIYNLWLNDDSYDPNEGDDFPYHYSKDTYQRLANLWNELERQRGKSGAHS